MTLLSSSRSRYGLSFTSGALLTREADIAIPLYQETADWNAVRRQIGKENLFQSRTASSAARVSRETVQHLTILALSELNLLPQLGISDRNLLMWIAACRRYSFIGEFAEEVVRERYLLLTPTLDYGEFDSFVSAKTLWHPELEELQISTRKKLRSNVFRMLTEAGLLTNNQIQQAMPSECVRDVLDARKPSDIRFLPVRASRKAI